MIRTVTGAPMPGRGKLPDQTYASVGFLAAPVSPSMVEGTIGAGSVDKSYRGVLSMGLGVLSVSLLLLLLFMVWCLSVVLLSWAGC